MTIAVPHDSTSWTEKAIEVSLATLDGQMQLARRAVLDGEITRAEAFQRFMLTIGATGPEVTHLASQLPPPTAPVTAQPPADPLFDALPQEAADSDSGADGGEVVEGELLEATVETTAEFDFDLHDHIDLAKTVTFTLSPNDD